MIFSSLSALRHSLAVGAFFSAIGLVAFSSTALADAAQATAAQGKKIFEERCVTCHGALGQGDGPVALALPPEMKPRNLQEGAFKVATDDEKMKQVIKQGGAAFGLNALMPAQADLSDADLASVVAHVRSLKK